MNPISHFQQLLQEAAAQTEPQRLLFVFAAAELPKGATLAQRERYLAGEGGALAPLMCVDKAPVELEDFADLLEESRHAGPPWQVVFAASLSGRRWLRPCAPAPPAASPPLTQLESPFCSTDPQRLGST
jgi:hypothetical protein